MCRIVQNAQNYAMCRIMQSAKLRNAHNYAMRKFLQWAELCKIQNYALHKIMQCTDLYNVQNCAKYKIMQSDELCKVHNYVMQTNYVICRIMQGAKLCNGTDAAESNSIQLKETIFVEPPDHLHQTSLFFF